MTRMEWYNALTKPTWTPDGGTIGLIWSLLYPVIAVTFGYVFVQAVRRKLPRLVAVPFAVNLVANLSFTPIQFGLRNLPLAAVDILIVLGSVVWCMVAVWPHARWVAVAQVPYLAWVNDFLLSALARAGAKYGTPRAAFAALVAGPST